MTRLLALVLLLAFAALVVTVPATNLNFQNPTDATQIRVISTGGTTGSISWVESSSGGNNYMAVSHTAGVPSYTGTYFILNSPSQSTYAAITYLGGGGRVGVGLFDSSGNAMWETQVGGTAGDRFEIKVSGGYARYYKNGVVVDTSGYLSQNPSYIGFGAYFNFFSTATNYLDDYVYGDSENKNTLGVSESDNNVYYILQDIVNSAKDGVYNQSTDTTVQSTYLPATWSRGNDTTPLTNQTIQLVSYPDNTVYAIYYTGDAFTGTINVEMKTKLLDVNAPDGYYVLYMPGQAAYSNIIMKKSNGASVAFNSKHYSTGDTATIITYVASGGYWDTSSYEYKLSLLGLTTGYVENYTITAQSGSFTHAWSSSNSPGVYYAFLYATSRSTGAEYILGYDYTTLSSYAGYGGYVNDAQTGATISGAFVNMSQDAVIGNSISGPDGNWSSGSVFSTGSALVINATSPGHKWYNYSWIPLAARTVTDVNVSLEPISTSYTGLAIGGVDRDFLYGRPIHGATVTVRNLSTGESYLKTTSMTGWYLCDDGALCSLQTKRPYDVWAFKLGYTNSTTEKAVTV